MSWANYMKPDMNWTLQIDGKKSGLCPNWTTKEAKTK